MYKMISYQRLQAEDSWDSQLFCGPASVVVFNKGKKTLAQRGAKCVEGMRDNTDAVEANSASEAPMIRQAHLGPFSFRLEEYHWESPAAEGTSTVQPGDVVLNKMRPVRAAWAMPRMPRHPVDPNCWIMKNLDVYLGFWVALLLNQPGYSEYLLRRSGAAILTRIGKKELLQLPVPDPPAGVKPLAEEAWELMDGYIGSQGDLVRLQQEVEVVVQEWGAAVGSAMVEGQSPVEGFYRFFPAAHVDDSLLPGHVQVASFQRNLIEEAGWVRLQDLLALAQPPKERLRTDPGMARYLRLRDVDTAFAPPWPEESPPPPALFRVYRQPLQAEEVLFSTMASAPNATLSVSPPPESVFITDHWARLRFRETPGAWALVLRSKSMARQLAFLATGSAVQFLRGEDLHHLVVPEIEPEVRERWEGRLRGILQRQTAFKQQWAGIMDRALNFFYVCHPSKEGS